MTEATLRTIETIERLKSSHYGNPRFRITFTDGSSAITQSDAAFGYAVGNQGMREGCRVAVEFTRAGRIAHMAPPTTRDVLRHHVTGAIERGEGEAIVAIEPGLVDANIRRCVQRRRYHWEDQAGTAAEGLTPPGRAYRCPVCAGFHVEPAADR